MSVWTSRIRPYLVDVAIAVDQLLNTVMGGYPDETLSSRIYRASLTSKLALAVRIIVDILFLPTGKGHCKRAYESELQRKQSFKQE